MYFAKDLKSDFQAMDLVAFTTPTPDKLLLTIVSKTEGNGLLPLPLSARAYVEGLLGDNALIVSMTAIKVPDTDAVGWTAEIIVPPADAKVTTIKDGE